MVESESEVQEQRRLGPKRLGAIKAKREDWGVVVRQWAEGKVLLEMYG